MRLISPNALIDAAKREMLDGREPANPEDWMRIMSFAAVNVAVDCRPAVCELLRIMYAMPISEEQVAAIVATHEY